MAKDNYCIYCGFKLFPEDHFCPNCGKRLDEKVETAAKTSKYNFIYDLFGIVAEEVDGVDLSQSNKSKKPSQGSYSSFSSTNKTTATNTPDYSNYKKGIANLKETYENKESNVLKLLEQKFPAGQLSYYRFKEEVDRCRVSFFKEADAADNMIELSDEYSDKIANELKNKVKVLEEIVGKMNDLQSELIISISNGDDGSDDEISNLINEMNDLIDSVKNYE